MIWWNKTDGKQLDTPSGKGDRLGGGLCPAVTSRWLTPVWRTPISDLWWLTARSLNPDNWEWMTTITMSAIGALTSVTVCSSDWVDARESDILSHSLCRHSLSSFRADTAATISSRSFLSAFSCKKRKGHQGMGDGGLLLLWIGSSEAG